MQGSQGTRPGAFALAGSSEHASVRSEGQAVRTRVLAITVNQPLTTHISILTSDFARNKLANESVARTSDAAQRLKQSVRIDAFAMDWVLAASPGFETLQLPMEIAPELRDDPKLLQPMSLNEHAAQVHLIKRSRDAELNHCGRRH